MKKIEIDNKISHKRMSVISGFGPHRILEMKIKQALDKTKDVFDIDRFQWKELDEEID